MGVAASDSGAMLGFMNILEGIVDLFINTFGITQPSDKARRQATWFILGLLVLTVVGVAVAGGVIYHLMNR